MTTLESVPDTIQCDNLPPTSMSWIKLNFDGSTIERRTTTSGVICDEIRRFFVPYARNYGRGSNNEKEALALLWGLKIAEARSVERLDIEGDSLFIIKVVKTDGNNN